MTITESLKNFFRTQNLKILIIIGIVYVVLSFGTSFMGFLAPEPPVALKEHISTDLIIELGGHFLFGAMAAIPFLDFDLIFLSGVFAMLIDSDHVLDALGFYVSGRPDHSFFFAVLSGLILYYAAKRLNLDKEKAIKFAFLGPVVVFAHISYDIFASYVFFVGKGYFFPLFDPFNFSIIPLTFSYSIIFEISAIAAAICGLYFSKRVKSSSKQMSLGVDQESTAVPQPQKPEKSLHFRKESRFVENALGDFKRVTEVIADMRIS